MNKYIQMPDEVSDMIADVISAIDYCRSLAEAERVTADTIKEMCEAFPNRFDPINSPYKTCRDRASAYDQIADMLVELKARRIQDRWIPVTESLPKDRKKVRVTAYWHERFQVMDASYYGDGVWWCVPFNNCGKHMRNDLHVIAWKPDDEPYEKEGE